MVRREDGAIQDDGDDAEMGGSVQRFKCSVGLGGALFSGKKKLCPLLQRPLKSTNTIIKLTEHRALDAKN